VFDTEVYFIPIKSHVAKKSCGRATAPFRIQNPYISTDDKTTDTKEYCFLRFLGFYNDVNMSTFK